MNLFNRAPFLCVLFILLFVLGACGSTGGDFRRTNYHTGTDGMTVDFVDGYPEVEAYENEPLPVSVELKNRGATDVPYDRMMLSFSYDPLYLQGPKTYDFDNNGFFFGRSEYYPDGDELMIDLFDFMTKEVVGLREAPETQLSALLCYEYMTYFSSEVCVDVDTYLRTGREQACEGKDLSASSQGAPVAITHVEVRNNPVNTGDGDFRFTRPEFIVTIRNVGRGIVVAPPQQRFQEACRLEDLSSTELNGVLINGTIFNLPLECKPAIVRLSEGEGKTRCTVPDNELGNPALLVQQNIMTVLQLNAHYIYRQPIFHELTINRNTFEDVDGFQGDGGFKAKGYAYDGSGNVVRDSDNSPVTLCEQAASSGSGPSGVYMNKNWSCTCDRDACLKMDQDGFCVYGLCPGNSECCDQNGFNGQ